MIRPTQPFHITRVVILIDRVRILTIIFASAFVCLCSVSAFAQVPKQNDDEVIRVTTDLLLFPVRIRDKQSRFPSLLTQNEVTLNDPDAVVRGLYLSPGVDRIALVFALDESGSLRDIITQQRDAAVGLLDRFSDKSSVAVVRFAETSNLAAPFAHDRSNARIAFDVPVRHNQHTAIFDAALRCVETFDTLPRVRSERRIVILISDGLDNASKVKPKTVIDTANDKHVSFYVIHLPLYEVRDGRIAVRRSTKGFQELAENTGGKYFLIHERHLDLPKDIDLTAVFHAIEEDLKSQYLLGFYLNEKARDGRRHVYSLSMPAGLDYQVRSQSYSRTHKFFVQGPP